MKNFTKICFAVGLFITITSKAQQNQLSSLDLKIKSTTMYLTGMGAPKDVPKAISILKECVDSGSTQALIELGVVHRTNRYGVLDINASRNYFKRAGDLGNPGGYYNLALSYKDQTNQIPDYTSAYNYFKIASEMGHSQSLYALAYLQFKGLGCTQNYTNAFIIFKQGAEEGRSNSMYFLGLCYRNGYGTTKNESLGIEWLQKAQQKGYFQAKKELENPIPENSNANANNNSRAINNKITDIRTIYGNFKKIESEIDANILIGDFTGKIIKYDWSNTFAIEQSDLTLSSTYNGKTFNAVWTESSKNETALDFTVSNSKISFINAAYKKQDYYSRGKEKEFIFENCTLDWALSGDSIYLFGTIQMFVKERNEPAKPQMVFLAKKLTTSEKAKILLKLKNDDGSNVNVFEKPTVLPNPTNGEFDLRFSIAAKSEVSITIADVNGNVVLNQPKKELEKGFYSLNFNLSNNAAGTYYVKVIIGKKTETVKLIKL